MIFNKGDWALIDGSKKAHRLVQSYWGLTAACRKTSTSKGTGTTHATTVEQEQMSDATTAEKCKICNR